MVKQSHEQEPEHLVAAVQSIYVLIPLQHSSMLAASAGCTCTSQIEESDT